MPVCWCNDCALMFVTDGPAAGQRCPRCAGGMLPATTREAFTWLTEQGASRFQPEGARGSAPPPEAVPAGGSAPTELRSEALYRDFEPLVRRLIDRYGKTPTLRRQLPGEIQRRFRELVESYDAAGGAPLKLYLVRALTTSIYAFASRHWEGGAASGSAGPVESRGPAAPAAPPGKQPRDEAAAQVSPPQLAGALRRLSRRYRRVVIWRYYEGRSMEEIGAALGIEPSAACALLEQALGALRRYLAAQEHSV